MIGLRCGAAILLVLAWGAVRGRATWDRLLAFREEFGSRLVDAPPTAEATLRALIGSHAPACDAVRAHVPLDARVLYLFGEPRAPWHTAVQPRRAAAYALVANGALVQTVPASWSERLASAGAFERGLAEDGEALWILDLASGAALVPELAAREIARGPGFVLFRAEARR